MDISEATIRLIIFSAIFTAMAGLEFLVPRRELRGGRGRRWFTNWGIFIIDIAMIRIVFPVAAVGIALFGETQGHGLAQLDAVKTLVAPFIIAVTGFLILDFGVWGTHLLAHRIPVLWRVHKIHHADVDMDVTTALRFHPIEILLSMLFKGALILCFGIPAIAVLVFEVVLNGSAMFNHANIRLPGPIDAVLRRIIVTPDMHRVHHSVHIDESDANFGFNLSLWDQLFGTYVPQPRDGHEAMKIGLENHQSEQPGKLWWSLALPFLRDRKGPHDG